MEFCHSRKGMGAAKKLFLFAILLVLCICVCNKGAQAAAGDLYVGSYSTNQVLLYNGTTGASMGVFASGGGLNAPYGLVFGPDGNLYVSSYNTSQVLRYNGSTGAFINSFISTASGGLNDPNFLIFKSNPTAVPTMNEWGMITFMVLAGFISVYYILRKKRG